MKASFLFSVTMLFFMSGCQSEKQAAYKNPKLPVGERVEDLLSRMTLEKKAAQMLAAEKEVYAMIAKEA